MAKYIDKQGLNHGVVQIDGTEYVTLDELIEIEAAAYDEGYKDGVEDSWQEGYDEGYADGESEFS